MDNNLLSIIITVISCMGGAGAWKFYEFIIKGKRDKEKIKKSEQTIYRDDLIYRVDKLEKGKDDCMSSLLNINAEVSALRVKLEFLEKENNVLKIKLQNY
tara:strand:- start:75 stop:374 length:300 start_codon:yes stop_codon:yes gene_type:complete